ncbi:MAG: molecular chaperone DnaJ [Chloroflexi bacterium]|nr:molecular chaperone DnaJ [Chloroflexota bacterium]
MATQRDYYEVLGISREANDEDIKKAFRKLAFQFHPDRNRDTGAEDKFKEINEAYEVLSDPQKRAAYDRFGQMGGTFGRGFEGFGFGGIGDIFDAFFGGMSTTATRTPQRGNDLRYEMAISFEEAAFGCEKEIEVQRTEICSACQGTGSQPGSQPARCPTCNGTGQVRRSQQSLFGRFINVSACERCHGDGRVITNPCNECRGSGRQRQKRKIAIRVPGGVDDGSQIRLTGEGDAGVYGGSPGNLYVLLAVKPHPLFQRENDNLIYELPLNFAQAALGDEVEVPTLNGPVKLRVPPGTQHGHVFRIRGKGIPHLRDGGRGDLIVAATLVTPRSLNKEQRRLFEDLSRMLERPEPSQPGEAKAGLFDRFKKKSSESSED